MKRRESLTDAKADARQWYEATGLHYDVVRCGYGYKAVQRRYSHGKSVMYTTFTARGRIKINFTEKDFSLRTARLADKYGVSTDTIRRRFKELGKPTNSSHRVVITKEELKEAMLRTPAKRYAVQRGVSSARIYKLCRDWNITPFPVQRGGRKRSIKNGGGIPPLQ